MPVLFAALFAENRAGILPRFLVPIFSIAKHIAFPPLPAYHSRHGGPAMKQRHSSFTLFLTTLAIVTGFAFSQAPPKDSSPKYDPATEATLKGSVEEMKLVPPAGPKPIAYLVIKSGQDSVQVYLCPKSFLDEMGVTFKPGEEIQLTGSKVTQSGADLTLAREVVKAGDTLTLRFKDGKPAW
jgi:hypothetical protein